MIRFITIFLFLLAFNTSASPKHVDYISICYHDVKDVWDDNPMTVTTEQLIKQLSWLKGHHYHPISIQDILDAKAGIKPLPSKAVLLTFDDGYQNFYRRIYPILREFNYPAVFALVTSWMETADNKLVHYGDDLKPRKDFLSWDQVREMMASGLIEIASHSNNLHRGIQGNPQGNKLPAATTRQYFPDKKRYETDQEFQQRISSDLKQSATTIFLHTGFRPRVIVWPYGAYSQEIMAIARKHGMSLSITLESGLNNLDSPVIQRYLVIDNPPLSDFVYDLNHLDKPEPIRVSHVDLDYIYDDDPEQIQRNLSKLLDRIKALKINTVYLQAYSDPDGDGNADALYFPNRHLPVRADLFNRIAWQLQTRARVNVYAWLPVLSFKTDLPDDWWVHEWKDGQAIRSQNNYQRLSPFHPQARQFITEIYEDLAKYSHFRGLLFHDDAFLTDFEDANPAAVKVLNGLSPNQQLQLKIKTLTGFTLDLADTVRFYRPSIKTARNLYANIIMNPQSTEWFAQSYTDFLQHYDYVALMAMPFMENAERPHQWFSHLVDRVSGAGLLALQKTVFELQTVDWRNQRKVRDSVLARQMNLLQQKNALNFGYYPDDFLTDSPSLFMLKELMTLEIFPFGT